MKLNKIFNMLSRTLLIASGILISNCLLITTNCFSQAWTQLANFGGGDRSAAVCFSIGNKIYTGTGFGNSNIFNDFWEYDTTSNAWTQKADFGGAARTFAVGFAIGNKGYIGIGSMGY